MLSILLFINSCKPLVTKRYKGDIFVADESIPTNSNDVTKEITVITLPYNYKYNPTAVIKIEEESIESVDKIDYGAEIDLSTITQIEVDSEWPFEAEINSLNDNNLAQFLGKVIFLCLNLKSDSLNSFLDKLLNKFAEVGINISNDLFEYIMRVLIAIPEVISFLNDNSNSFYIASKSFNRIFLYYTCELVKRLEIDRIEESMFDIDKIVDSKEKIAKSSIDLKRVFWFHKVLTVTKQCYESIDKNRRFNKDLKYCIGNIETIRSLAILTDE